MGSLVYIFWALVYVCVVVEARPSTSVADTPLDGSRGSRAQNPLESSEPFWIFHTPNRPVMYLPRYNSVIVPASSDQVPAFESPPYHTLVQPPRRRRPLISILKLLQGGRLTLNSDGELVEVLDQPDTEIPRDKYKKEHSVSENHESGVNNSDKRTELLSQLNGYVNSNYGRNIPDQTFASNYVRFPLVDLPKASETPDLDDGFSYMYKYSSPKSRSSDVEVSVQRGKNKAYPHVVNKQSFEEVKDNTALKLVSPLSVSTSNKALSRQSIHNLQHDNESSGTKVNTDNTEELDEEEESKKSTTVIADGSSDRLRPTKLILKPSAKAVAGAKGVAIASPVARAVIRKGQKVTLEFDPEAVAIAGPGGRAHAHPEFTIDYIDEDSDLSDSELLKKLNH